MDENLKRAILKYREVVPKDIFPRDLSIPESKLNKAFIVIGPRRAGKTFFLYNIFKKEKNPVFMNFEDNLLYDLKPNDLNNILVYSKELFGTNNLSFFFDEIQEANGWEKFIVSLLNENYTVFITGSNSNLLSKEIATSLRGKSLSFLLLPLSFSEYLKFVGIKLEKNFEHSNQIFIIKKEFENFMKYGGFPEVVLSNSLDLKNKLINNYFDSVLYTDLVDRLQLKNIKLVEITMKYLLNLFGNLFSISAYERYLKSNKIPYSLEDLYVIIKALNDVFLFGYVKEFSKSYKKEEYSKSKVYVFDTGYINFLANEPEDFGRILENVVFIELFRRQENIENKNIFYFNSNGKECDFVVRDRDNVKEAIQVTYELNDGNRKREIDGIINALDFFKQKKGLILTMNQEEKLKIDGKEILIMPIWKWILLKD